MQPQQRKIGSLTTAFLKECGFGQAYIDELDERTRLLQDLHWCGDTAEDYLEVMQEKFGVDFSSFSFFNYFPSELSRDALMLTILGRTRWGKHIKDQYPPITLSMIEQALETKRWPFD